MSNEAKIGNDQKAVTDDILIAAARAAREQAYAPYSHYKVGCAILADGEIFTGTNVENASYGLTVCAERSATSAAIVAGKRRFDVVAVLTDSTPPATPCGMCRQTLSEFAGQNRSPQTPLTPLTPLTPQTPRSQMRIITTNLAGDRVDYTIEELLPAGFSGDQLG